MRVALYCRLSEEDRNKQGFDESLSIQNQRSMLTQYAKSQNWQIVDVYSDEDYSGADRFRPEFCRMINDCENGKIDIVLCKTQSRFSRELEIIEKYLHTLFPIWNVRFVSIVDCADTQKKENKKARQINGLINEWYLEDLSENIKSVLTSRRKDGLHIGAFAPYGYIKDKEHKGHLLIDEVSANIVRRIFSMYIEGYGKSAIARVLNEQCVPCPSQYKKLCGEKYVSKGVSCLWRYSTISSILCNQMYIGNMVQGRYKSVSYKSKKIQTVPKDEWIIAYNTHTAIIDENTWGKVQEIMSGKEKMCSKGKKSSFSGIVRCKECGCVLRKSQSRGKVYFKCPTHYISKHSCEGCFISEKLLKETAMQKISLFLSTYLDKNVLYKKLSDMTLQNNNIDNLNALSKRKDDIVLQIKSLHESLTHGIITQSEFSLLMQSYRLDERSIDSLIGKTTQNQSKHDFSFPEISHQLYSLLHDKDKEFILFHSLIECIYVKKRQKGQLCIPIEIQWRF